MLKINNFGQFFQFFNTRRNIAMWCLTCRLLLQAKYGALRV